MDHDFIDRLAAAIAHIPALQLRNLRKFHPSASGVHGLVSAACGMKTQSTLSDVLSGRIPGTKYRTILAETLCVDSGWLDGTGGSAPDWTLSPMAAWRRFEEALRRRCAEGDEDQSQSGKPARNDPCRSTVLASRYGLDARSPIPVALASGRYTEVPFDVVLLHARHCGMAQPTHPDHLREGHGMWMAIHKDIQREVERERQRWKRLVPPRRLFDAVRSAMAKNARPSTMSATTAGDALEMLWRQQWLAAGKPRQEFPPEMTEDTGRDSWTKLEDIRRRWG